MGADVFIVHAASDKALAGKLADALDAAKVGRFFDERDQEAGAPWDEAIGRELRSSPLQVVLPGRSDRWYRREEVNLAIKNMRRVGVDGRVVPCS